jgi:hypothetical protein
LFFVELLLYDEVAIHTKSYYFEDDVVDDQGISDRAGTIGTHNQSQDWRDTHRATGSLPPLMRVQNLLRLEYQECKLSARLTCIAIMNMLAHRALSGTYTIPFRFLDLAGRVLIIRRAIT